MKISLAQLSDDPIYFSQPLMFKRHVQNEAETSKRHVQRRSNLNP
jgi:hypothetical protein